MNFGAEIIKWYELNKRELPWRNTRNPYLIWLSEIILQQTRVTQGMPYYYKFEQQFATILDFADASEDEVLKLWQGLGYYSRARNMLKTAIEIKNKYGGIFPTAYADLIKLTGIGSYTASAISSFSVDEKQAVVDGNVYRLLARYYGIDKPINSSEGVKYFKILAQDLLQNNLPSQYNQAIMEFGALVCSPKPNCNGCILSLNCWALKHKKTEILPIKIKKKPIKKRFIYFFVIRKGNKIIIKRRGNNDIWEGLHDFPSIESTVFKTAEDIIDDVQFKISFGTNVVIDRIGTPVKHLLTHQTLFAQFIEISNTSEECVQPKEWFYVSINEVENYAQPKLIFAFLKNYLT